MGRSAGSTKSCFLACRRCSYQSEASLLLATSTPGLLSVQDLHLAMQGDFPRDWGSVLCDAGFGQAVRVGKASRSRIGRVLLLLALRAGLNGRQRKGLVRGRAARVATMATGRY